MIKVREEYIFLLIFIIACLFRIVNFNVVPLFSDTANYARISAEIAEGDYWLTGPNASDKPPVYFYLQALFFALFGVKESVALLTSFLAGLLSVLLTYVLCKNLHGELAGRWAALMMAVSPTATEMSVLGLVDSLLVTTILWSLWLLSKERFFWGGLVIGLAFGIKQTTLVFGPLYFYWIICTTRQRNTKTNSVIKSLISSGSGFGIVFLSILYWTIFLAEQRLKIFADIVWRLGIVEKVSGHGIREFEGDVGWRISELADRFSQMIGISWHFIVPFFFLGISSSLGRILKNKLKKEVNKSFIPDWINIGIFGFVTFYLYIYIFHLNKLGGIAYLYPIFPLIILTIAFLLADLQVYMEALNSKILKKNNVNILNRSVIYSLIGAIIIFWIFNASINKVRQNITFSESMPYQEIDTVANRLREYINSKSMIFANQVGWGLDFYLRGVNNRREAYYLGENLEDMKSLLKTEPYTNFYILFYRSLFHQIEEVRKVLAGKFVLEPEFESNEGNFRFFRILPIFSDNFSLIKKMGDSWNQNWELWTKEKIREKWNPETLKIETQNNNKTGKVEIQIYASQTPLGLIPADQVEILIENPVINANLSLFYKWPVFKSYDEISINYVMRDRTIEQEILNKFNQVKNVLIRTSKENIKIKVSGEMNGNTLDIVSRVSLIPKNYFTDIDILDIQVNDWGLNWLTKLFRNRLIQPLKINRLHLFDSELVDIAGQSGLNNFNYRGIK